MMLSIGFLVICIVLLLVCAAVFVGVIVLQCRLSRLGAAWPGLVVIVLLAAFGVFALFGAEAVARVVFGFGAFSKTVMLGFGLVAMLPAAISCVIYLVCRIARRGGR